ncbi:MAG TPA: M20/M25/M40 family metallo-hydrolase [Anaerolineae bacterium]|nr:M20/M25/M40 family metallo-hydrolase [Anaerolineae bacterium]
MPLKRWSHIVILSLWLLASVAPVIAQPAGPFVLARVDLDGPPQSLGLPVYAHLQDAAGQSYALVIAPAPRLAQSDHAYQTLDTQPSAPSTQHSALSPQSYLLLLLPRRPAARAAAARLVPILHDDGRQLLVRATPAQAEQLAALGCDLAWLPDAPLVLDTPTAPLRAAFTPDPLVADMMAQIQQSDLYSYTAQLTGVWPTTVGGDPYTITTRHTASGVPVQKATAWAYEHLQALGLAVSYHDWTYGAYSNRNIIAELPGAETPDGIVLITAHIDNLPASGSAPGADDNASGSIGVLTAAQLMSQHTFSRTVRFVLFTGEEQGMYGSKRYADLVSAAGDDIVAVYNMDMIAWDNVGGPTLRLHIRAAANPGYPGDLAIAGVFTNVVEAYGLDAALTPIIDPDGLLFSDHSFFWNKGYPAILAIEDDNDDFNDYYHTAGDRLSTLNMAYYTAYVKASVGTAAHLAGPLGDQPVAGFTSSSPDAPGETTVFTNTTLGADLTYQWDFGDDSPLSTATHPTHTYAALGVYPVVLTATNMTGSDVATGTVIITESPCDPVRNAAFTFTPFTPTLTTLNIGVMVIFTGTAAGTPPITYTWDFGDNAMGSGNPVHHTYLLTGAHTVVMTATNACGVGVVTRTLTILPPPPEPHNIYLPLVLKS